MAAAQIIYVRIIMIDSLAACARVILKKTLSDENMCSWSCASSLHLYVALLQAPADSHQGD